MRNVISVISNVFSVMSKAQPPSEQGTSVISVLSPRLLVVWRPVIGVPAARGVRVLLKRVPVPRAVDEHLQSG